MVRCVPLRVMTDVYEESDHMMAARTDTFLSPSLSGGLVGQAWTVDTTYIIWFKIVFDILIFHLGQILIQRKDLIPVSGHCQKQRKVKYTFLRKFKQIRPAWAWAAYLMGLWWQPGNGNTVCWPQKILPWKHCIPFPHPAPLPPATHPTACHHSSTTTPHEVGYILSTDDNF